MTDRTLLGRLGLIRDSFPRTPVVRLVHDQLDLFAKLEFSNPNGTAKDRSAYWILQEAIGRGEITEGTTVVESSSGNFAVSMASFCRTLGLRFVPVLDPNVNAPTEAFLQIACERVEKVLDIDETGGFLLGRLDRVRRLRSKIDQVYWPDQYSNVDAAAGHHALTGGELNDSFSAIDYVFVGVGTGATIAGLSQRIKEFSPRVKVIGVDTEGSVISGGPPKRRFIPGIGSSIHPPLVEQALIDDMVVIPEAEAVVACHDLLRAHGIFAGGSTGSVYAAIQRYFDGYRGPRPTVVFLCADRGSAYSDTVYNSSWVRRTIGQEAPPPQLLTTSIATR